MAPEAPDIAMIRRFMAGVPFFATRRPAPTSAPPGRFDGSDVDLPHLHHRFESPLGGRAIGIGERVDEGAWRDLPRQAPFVLAPAAGAFLAAVADDGVPQTVRFGLVVRRDLERESLVVLELRAAVQSDAGDA